MRKMLKSVVQKIVKSSGAGWLPWAVGGAEAGPGGYGSAMGEAVSMWAKGTIDPTAVLGGEGGILEEPGRRLSAKGEGGELREDE